MIRQWQVQPDLLTQDGLPVVSLQALQQALLEGVTMVHRAGGNLSLVVGRHPTDLQGEMLTTGAVVTWMDRTDAKPQPEAQRSLGEPQQFVPAWSENEMAASDSDEAATDEDDELAATEAEIQRLKTQGKTDEEITAVLTEA